MKSEKHIHYKYNFEFEDGSTKSISIILDSLKLEMINDVDLEKPDWSSFEQFNCPISCSLQNSSSHCPLAININHIVKIFSGMPSYERTKISVETPNRTYYKESSLQVGIGSLLGIIMPTCGCPTLGKLKPLVKYHLPFATIDETEFRVFSMYLLAQFILMKKNKNPDWEMKKLKLMYEEIQEINKNVAKKIADIEKLDASINSVIVLNNFADSVSFSLEENLSAFESLFESWFED